MKTQTHKRWHALWRFCLWWAFIALLPVCLLLCYLQIIYQKHPGQILQLDSRHNSFIKKQPSQMWSWLTKSYLCIGGRQMLKWDWLAYLQKLGELDLTRAKHLLITTKCSTKTQISKIHKRILQEKGVVIWTLLFAFTQIGGLEWMLNYDFSKYVMTWSF